MRCDCEFSDCEGSCFLDAEDLPYSWFHYRPIPTTATVKTNITLFRHTRPDRVSLFYHSIPCRTETLLYICIRIPKHNKPGEGPESSAQGVLYPRGAGYPVKFFQILLCLWVTKSTLSLPGLRKASSEWFLPSLTNAPFLTGKGLNGWTLTIRMMTTRLGGWWPGAGPTRPWPAFSSASAAQRRLTWSMRTPQWYAPSALTGSGSRGPGATSRPSRSCTASSRCTEGASSLPARAHLSRGCMKAATLRGITTSSSWTMLWTTVRSMPNLSP